MRIITVAFPRGLRSMASGAATATALVVMLAVALVSAGGCDKKSDASTDTPGAQAASGELRVTADEHGFTPASLTVPKGGPGSLATVTFVRTTDQTCATEVVFPDLNVKKSLPLNTPVAVEVPSDAARTLAFQCGMGMYKGAMVVH
jgi:plastocyanin domain-containing protein